LIVESWKLEAGSWKLEAGSWKLEARTKAHFSYQRQAGNIGICVFLFQLLASGF
jgi:hypothetical protein